MIIGKKNEKEIGNIDCMIGERTKVKGDFESGGSIHVSGQVEGNLRAEGEILVTEVGKIKGDIKALKATISGNIEGNVVVEKNLEVSKTGKISGDLQAENVIIEEGASYCGKVIVGKGASKGSGLLPEEDNL